MPVIPDLLHAELQARAGSISKMRKVKCVRNAFAGNTAVAVNQAVLAISSGFFSGVCLALFVAFWFLFVLLGVFLLGVFLLDVFLLDVFWVDVFFGIFGSGGVGRMLDKSVSGISDG